MTGDKAKAPRAAILESTQKEPAAKEAVLPEALRRIERSALRQLGSESARL